MARPRKKPIPIEAEVREFLESKKGDQKTSLSVREIVAAIMLAGQLAAGGNRSLNAGTMKRQAFEWADFFLED